MRNVEQMPIWYYNHTSMKSIYQSINEHIEDGWRVHTCLERYSDVIIIYERDLADLELRG